jgi:peptidoglycan/xylan/chitin deacetylase (PgdA/CDA1 family)
MTWRSLIHDPVASLLERGLRRRHRGELRVLMFHGLTDREHTGLENCQHKHLHVARFEAVAAHLAAHYDVMSMDDLVERLENGRAFPPFPAVLTFDDGFASNYHLAYPVLRRHGLPAIIYLETEFVDEKIPIWADRVDFAMHRAGRSKAELVSLKTRLKTLPQSAVLAAVEQLEEQTGHRLGRVDHEDVPAIHQALNWDQVREMAAGGLVTFGSHTHTHVIMGRAAPEIIRHELMESRRRIELETGLPCLHFCYPNGTPSDFSETCEQILREGGFRSSVTTVGGLNPLPCSPFLLRRLGMTNNLRPAQFRQFLAMGDPTLRGLLC